jgi:hypothetical protein
MDHHYELKEDLEWDIYEEIHSLIQINPWAWQSIGAVSGLVGGVLSPVLGTLLIAVTRFIHSDGLVSSLNILIIVSFALIIPLLAFGAHCLDLLERKTASLPLIEEQRSQGLVFNFLELGQYRGTGQAPTQTNERMRCGGISVRASGIRVHSANHLQRANH